LSAAANVAGAAVVLVATAQFGELVEEMGHFVSGGRMRLADEEPRTMRDPGVQMILVDRAAMDGHLGRNSLSSLAKRKAGRKVKVEMALEYAPKSRTVVSENVLAYIEGSDKKDELVVITAHYDHIGIEGDEVFNGADDDGSGTVAIMAIAKAFAKAKQEGNGPRRSVLVMPVSAEEKGLLGSKYYSENPVFPLENTVANLNIDMIGRIDSAHQGMAPYIYVIGSDRLSSELHTINEEANRNYTRMELDYTFNSADDPNRFYYRSDHYNFARKGVPAIFYFSGVHEDYHKSTDTVDKIRFDLVHKRALLTFHTAWILANREERIVVDGKVE
jgi:Zn-dependent M28 family amino/carboxypeptidase